MIAAPRKSIHDLADELERAREGWHAAWFGGGWNTPAEREAYERYQEAIAALGAALVNREMARLDWAGVE